MKSDRVLFRFLRMMGSRLWLYLFAIFMTTAFNAVFDVINSVFVKLVFEIAQNADRTGLYTALPVSVVAAVFSVIISVIFMNVYNNEAKRASVELRQRVFAKAMRLPMRYYDTHHSGELISRLVFDAGKASEVYASRLRRVIAPIISLFVYTAAMLIISPFMTLILIALNVVMLAANMLLSKPMKRVARDMAEQNAVMTEKLSNLIAGMQICKMYDNAHRTVKQYIDANERLALVQKKKMCLSALLESLNSGFDLLCALMFPVVGIYFLQNNMATLGEVAAIYTMYTALSFRFLQLGKYWPELINRLAYARRIFEFMDEEEETDVTGKPAESADIVTEGPYAVEITALSFAYDGSHEVFDNISLAVPRGKNVALTGKSGCGKSTLAKLLLGFYPYASGDIKLFGVQVRKLGFERVRKMVAYVPQEPYLFEVSIMQNIRYGRNSASDEDVIKAAKQANAHEFIIMQKDGYQTVVSNRGESLSGGERQRIAIARAILTDAPVILMDEATSALDNESERLILEAVKKLKEKTVIMIAHRKATIEAADVEITMSPD